MSPRLPRITAVEVMRALKRDGWKQVRRCGSHIILTLESILEQAELTVDDLRELL